MPNRGADFQVNQPSRFASFNGRVVEPSGPAKPSARLLASADGKVQKELVGGRKRAPKKGYEKTARIWFSLLSLVWGCCFFFSVDGRIVFLQNKSIQNMDASDRILSIWALAHPDFN